MRRTSLELSVVVVVGHQKTWFSESFAGVEGASDIIHAAGASIRQSSRSTHASRKLYGGWGGGREPRCRKQRGSGSPTFSRRPPSKLVLPWHEPLPLSRPACESGWRFMPKWFCGSEFVAASDARRCSGSARAAIAGSAIRARLAARKPGRGSIVRPTGGTSGVRKAG